MTRNIDIAYITLILAPSLLTTTQKVFQVTSPAYVLVIKLLRLIACSATNACCYLACAVNSLFFWHYVIRPTWHLFRNFVEQEWPKSYSSSNTKTGKQTLMFPRRHCHSQFILSFTHMISVARRNLRMNKHGLLWRCCQETSDFTKCLMVLFFFFNVSPCIFQFNNR